MSPQHPKGQILAILEDVGVPNGELHDAAGRIQQAYNEANEHGQPVDLPMDPFALLTNRDKKASER